VKPVLVVVLVDALGWTLAGREPAFAPRLRERRPLATVLGFSSGALPTAFTGRPAREHGRWLMYERARGPGVFRGFGALRWLPERVRSSGRMTRLLERVVAGRGVRGYFNLYEVPRAELAAFDLPERGDIFAPGGLPCASLWDSLERRGTAWRGWNWRTPESQSRAEALDCLAGGAHDFLFLYSAVLDARFHHEGSHGAGVKASLAEWSAWFDAAAGAAERGGREPWLYLCSDHGMVDVRSHVDVMARVAALPHRRGRDYLAFFDSTMARFWWREPRVRDDIRTALTAEPRGRWLTPGELASAGADFADARYGDDIFLLEPGALLLPSFMGRAPVAAMHGYDPSHPDMAGILASNRPLPAGVTHLAHLRAFLEGELDAAGATPASRLGAAS
jgi:hypothetical protein